MPIGRQQIIGQRTRATRLCVRVSITSMAPPFSDVMSARELSGER